MAGSIHELYVYILLLVPAIALAGRLPWQRVIGGSQSEDGAWPWQLSLRFGNAHSCGAALLGNKHALTAAHCVGNSPVLYEIVAGTNNRSCDDDSCVTRRLDAVKRHPDFIDSGGAGYPNDIAVITWTLTLVPSAKIRAVPLASYDNHLDCIITGWGRLTAAGTLPELLHEAPIDLISNTRCRDIWSSVQVTDSQVCIMDTTSQTATPCSGDSGGPVVCKTSWTAPWELVGIVSWGRTGCPVNVATVCSRVSSFSDWIQSVAP